MSNANESSPAATTSANMASSPTREGANKAISRTNAPTISLIIPVYNTAEYLPRCMDSVLAQTYQMLEILLVDDGSSDASPELCDAYSRADKRIRVIHQENKGLSSARNAGLDAATGEYIGFVDSDDWIEPDTYAFLLDLLELKDADISEMMLDVAYTADHMMRQPTEKTWVFEGEDILVYYFRHNEFAMGLRLYRSDIFANLRFDTGRMNEDVVAGFLALSAAKRLVASNQLKYYYFSNPSGLSESPLSKRDFDLLYAGERLDELTVRTQNAKVRELALTKKRRAPFTLLVKMAVFGCSKDIDKYQTKNELQKEARTHYKFLVRSDMPTNRKIMLTVSCYCYPLLRAAGIAYQFIKRLKLKSSS